MGERREGEKRRRREGEKRERERSLHVIRMTVSSNKPVEVRVS